MSFTAQDYRVAQAIAEDFDFDEAADAFREAFVERQATERRWLEGTTEIGNYIWNLDPRDVASFNGSLLVSWLIEHDWTPPAGLL